MELRQAYNQNPNATSLDLKNKNLRDFKQVFKELENFKELIDVDISNNNLEDIPENLTKLQRLRSIDITNNPLFNFEKCTLALATIPNLIDLKINLSTQTEALMILSNIPNLIYLNGKSTREETYAIDIDDKDVENFSLNSEISNFNVIFTKISDKLKTITKEKQKVFFEDFQVLLKTEIDKINKSVDNAVPNYYYAANVLYSKIKIFTYFNESYFEYMEGKEKDSSVILEEILKNMKESFEYIYEIIMKLYPKIEEKAESFKIQLENAYKSTTNNQTEGGSSYLEEKIKSMQLERESLLKQHDDEKQFLLDKITKLEFENKVMTEKLLKSAKSLTTNEIHHKKQIKGGENDLVGGGSQIYHQNYGNVDTNTKKNAVIIAGTGSKMITKKTIKEMIEEIYESKANFDKRCSENKLPKETMEQHMYTFLNHKYGLKNLIIEWAASLVNGVKVFSTEDSDICLFGKILRNELEEDSRLVIQRLKATIQEILTFFLKAKNPLKSNAHIKDIVKQKLDSLLIEDEWKGIIYYVYENDDAKYLESKIIEFVRRKNLENKPEINRKISRDEAFNLSKVKEEFKILYNDFQKILLDFQIKSRDKFLKNFSMLFKKCDSNNDGLINEMEFNILLNYLNQYSDSLEENKLRYLSILDPYSNGTINFSDAVSLFSSEMFNEVDEFGNKKRISILDKICTDENFLENLNTENIDINHTDQEVQNNEPASMEN